MAMCKNSKHPTQAEYPGLVFFLYLLKMSFRIYIWLIKSEIYGYVHKPKI